MTKKFESYFPEPVNGQAILSNFNRVLTYKGSNDLGSQLIRGMPLYETELLETVGNQNSGNYVFRGDCISTCAYLKNNNIKVDLVYIDPPFASGADYAKTIFLRHNPKIEEAIEEAKDELNIDDFKQFEEKMYGDIWDKEKYLNWIYENLLAIRSIMTENGSIFVHLDYHIGHYVKIILDEIFGEDNFRSEIIWKRSTAHSDNSGFANLHDTIYYYTKSENSIFNTQYVPYSQDYIDTYFRHQDEDGRRYLDRDLSAKGLQGSGYTYEWKGKSGYWRCPISTMEDYEKNNRIYYTSNGTPRYKQYLDEMPGVPAQDIWTDIFAVNSQAAERIDYSTQKPEALLERIIKSSSNEGMIVADFFGGSGVTAAVASKLNRNFIHSDVNINSIQTTRDRLLANNTSFEVLEIKDGVSLYRNPVQTMNKLKSLIIGLKNEDSLDKFWEGAISDPKYGLVPVYVPNLMDSSTRILDDVLMRRILHEAMPDLDTTVKKVIVYYIDIENKSAIDNLIKDDIENDIEIEFRDLKEILDDVITEDELVFNLVEDREKLSGYLVEINEFHSDTVSRRISSFNLKSAQNDKKGKFKPIVIDESGLELIELISIDWTNSDGPWHSDHEIKIGTDNNLIINGVKTKSKWDGKVHSDKKPLRIKVRNICGDENIFKV